MRIEFVIGFFHGRWRNGIGPVDVWVDLFAMKLTCEYPDKDHARFIFDINRDDLLDDDVRQWIDGLKYAWMKLNSIKEQEGGFK